MNIFENFKNREELAFFLASKIVKNKFQDETEREIEKIIKEFISGIIKEDKNAVYFEEFDYLLKDLEKTKNYNEFVVLNPYFAKNHNFKYYELIKRLKGFIFTEKCKYIIKILTMLKDSNINLEELRGFKIENLKITSLVKYLLNLKTFFK